MLFRYKIQCGVPIARIKLVLRWWLQPLA